MSDSLRVVYAGTPEFAVPTLERLIADDLEIVAVYTQPDRPAGRGRRLQPSPVKRSALEHGLRIMQPSSLKGEEASRDLRALAPDIVIVAAYGQILPAGILEIPVHGCVNVHASLLPRWRGAAPVARALEAGDTKTGISIMCMDEGMDTGGVIARRAIDVDEGDNAGSLTRKLAQLGPETLAGCLPGYISGQLVPEPQDPDLVTYAPKLMKSEAPLDWSKSAATIRNKVRALNPWPVAQTWHRGNRIRILEAEIASPDGSGGEHCGRVLAAEKRGIEVCCGQGRLRLTVLQKDHGKPLAARDFLNGYTVSGGDQLAGAPARDPR